MSRFSELDDVTRRNSVTKEQHQKNLLDYAQLCSDQEEIYEFMEEHNYGIELVEFWLARANFAIGLRKCGFAYLYLLEARRVCEMSRTCVFNNIADFIKVEREEKRLVTILRNAIRANTKGPRTLRQYQAMYDKSSNFTAPACKKMIGNVCIFVDQDVGNQVDQLITQYFSVCESDVEYNQNYMRSLLERRPQSWIKLQAARQAMNDVLKDAVVAPDSEDVYSVASSSVRDHSEANFQSPKNARRKSTLQQQDSVQILKRTSFARSAAPCSRNQLLVPDLSRGFQDLDQPVEMFRACSEVQQRLSEQDSFQFARIQDSCMVQTPKFTLQQKRISFIHAQTFGKSPLSINMKGMEVQINELHSLSPTNRTNGEYPTQEFQNSFTFKSPDFKRSSLVIGNYYREQPDSPSEILSVLNQQLSIAHISTSDFTFKKAKDEGELSFGSYDLR